MQESRYQKPKQVLETQTKRYPFWLRFNTWFVLAVGTYWILTNLCLAYSSGIWGITDGDISSPFALSCDNDGYAGVPGTFIGNFVGLFAPIGPSNVLFLFILPGGWIALALNILALIFVEKFFASAPEHDGPVAKVFINLAILFFLAMATDFLTFMHWPSMQIFIESIPGI